MCKGHIKFEDAKDVSGKIPFFCIDCNCVVVHSESDQIELPSFLQEVAEKSLRYHGFTEQLYKTIEECSELITALLHYRDEKCDTLKVLNELSDVVLMCEQISMHFGKKDFETVLFKTLERRREYLKARGVL